MSDKPLPQGSGLGAARSEPGSRRCARCASKEIVVGAKRALPLLGSTSLLQLGTPRPWSGCVSNITATLATKPVCWSSPFHRLAVGNSAKMSDAGCARAAVVHCARL
jgi:hypothetical protein